MNRPSTFQIFCLFVRTGLRRVLNRTTLAKEMMAEKKKAKAKGAASSKTAAPRTATIRKGAKRSITGRIAVSLFIMILVFGLGVMTMMPTFTSMALVRLNEARNADVIPVLRSDYEAIKAAAALTDKTQQKEQLDKATSKLVSGWGVSMVLYDMGKLAVERFEAKGLAAFTPVDPSSRWSGDLALLTEQGRSRALKFAGLFLLSFNVSLALSWFGMMGSSLKTGDSELAWLFQFPASRRILFLSKLIASSFDNPAILVTPIVSGIVLANCGFGTASCLALAALFALSTAIALGAIRLFAESFLVHRCSRKTRGTFVATATMIGSLGVMFAVNVTSREGMINFISDVADVIPSIFYCNPLSACLGTVSSDAGMASPWWAAVPLGAIAFAFVAVCGCTRFVSDGVESKKDTVRGKRQKAKMGLVERFFRGMAWKEVIHLLRQRALVLQMVLAPIPILFVFYIQNPERALDLMTRDAGTMTTTLFGVFTYAIMCAAGTLAKTELTTVWFLQCLPRSLADCIRTKARVWASLAIGLALAMLAGAALTFPLDYAGLAVRLPFLLGFLWLYTEITYGFVALKSRIESDEKASMCPTAWIVPVLLAGGCSLMLHSGGAWQSFSMLAGMFVLNLAIRQRQEVELRWLTEPVEKPPARLYAMHALVGILAFVVLQSVFEFFLSLTSLGDRGVIALGYYGSALLISAMIWLWMRSKNLKMDIVPRSAKVLKPLLASVAMAAAVGVGLVAVFQYVPDIATVSQQLLRVPTRFALDEWESMLMISTTVIAAPLFEEWLFRGMLYRSLRKSWGVGLSITLTTLIFTVIHPMAAVVAVVALSVVTCWLVERTGKVWPGIVAHMALNAVVAASWNLTTV